MRATAPLAPLALLLAATLAGCSGAPSPAVDPRVAEALEACRAAPAVPRTLFFAQGHTLQAEAPAGQGAEPGNAFSSGFLTNDLKEWLSEPAAQGLWLVGNVTLDYWVRSTGTPAPLAVDPDRPGDGYHFFNQFGSDRSLQPAYATEFAPVSPLPGTVDHYTETLALVDGGFVVEPGDRVRVLLTDLALDGPGGSGHEVLYGGDTPSSVSFTARCFPTLRWEGDVVVDEAVTLAGNQGLLTGAVEPREGVNVQTVPLRLPEGTQRVTVRLTQANDANPAKDDIDLVLLEVGGERQYAIGSPYSDERGALWADNLQAHFPNGDVDVQVNSYSGAAYEGRLVVTAERATLV